MMPTMVCKPIDGISRGRYREIRDRVVRNTFRILADRWPNVTNTAIGTAEILEVWTESRMDEIAADPPSEGEMARIAEDARVLTKAIVNSIIDGYHKTAASGADLSTWDELGIFGEDAAMLIGRNSSR